MLAGRSFRPAMLVAAWRPAVTMVVVIGAAMAAGGARGPQAELTASRQVSMQAQTASLRVTSTEQSGPLPDAAFAAVPWPVRTVAGQSSSASRYVTTLTSSGIPALAYRAYVAAAKQLAVSDPSCQLNWSVLAGIGRVESNHGRFGGSRITPQGMVTPPILGIRLDGSRPGTATIHDSDNGRWDGDRVTDRAVGPMQFLPGTWKAYGGGADPQNMEAAALAAGRYLCRGTSSLATASGRWAAVYRYNHSDSYVSLVLSLADTYRNGEETGLPARPAETQTTDDDTSATPDGDPPAVVIPKPGPVATPSPAPATSAPVASAPVASAPVASAPVVSAPVVSPSPAPEPTTTPTGEPSPTATSSPTSTSLPTSTASPSSTAPAPTCTAPSPPISPSATPPSATSAPLITPTPAPTPTPPTTPAPAPTTAPTSAPIPAPSATPGGAAEPGGPAESPLPATSCS